MKKMTKKLWGLLLVVAMVGTLFAGCGNKAPETSAPETQAPAPVETQAAETEATDELSGTITIGMPAYPGGEQGWKAVAERYNEYHPNVEIVIDLKPGDGYGEWITNICRSEDPAVDIAAFDSGDYTAVTMIDFSDYADMDSPYSDGTWSEQFDPSAMDISRVTGRIEKMYMFTTQVMWMYNKEIFEEVGVEVPETWDELVAVCEKLDAAGYQPLALDGDYASYQASGMSWLTQTYIDQSTRPLIELIRAQEGDYCFDPDVDGVWTYDPTDPWNDATSNVNQNIVRVVKEIYEADEFRVDTAGAKTMWENFAKVFPKYCGGEAWFATGAGEAGNAFYQGEAAMYVSGGWSIVGYLRMMEEFEANGFYVDEEGNEISGETFTLGTFPMPDMEGEGIVASARTIEGPSVGIMCMSKDQEHNDLVMDFMMFLTSAEGMGLYINEMLANGGSVDGPSTVYDVEYPEKVAAAFEDIELVGTAGSGYLNLWTKGVPLVDESGREFYNNSYKYFMGEITVDELLAGLQENVATYLPYLMQGLNISEEDIKNPANAPAGY